MPIRTILARQIFDSRGNPTVEVDLVTELGLFRASVPSGSTISVHEAKELRDEVPTDYRGLSVFNAIKNINTIIAPELIKSNIEVTQQRELDNFLKSLDGTENKSMLGSNAILGVSLAACKAGAAKRGMPLYRHVADLAGNGTLILPVPSFNVINGGNRANNKLAMQEFLILPTGAQSFAEAMKMGSDVYQYLKDMIEEKFGLDSTMVGPEGGFSPNLQYNKDALQLTVEAIKRAGYAGKIEIGLDMAASVFFKNGTYDTDFKNPTSNPSEYLTSDKLNDMYLDFAKEYPLISIEDPFEQDDWPAWASLMNRTGIQIVGDDLTATNPNRINIAIDRKACNCILLKMNQIGTVSEVIDAQKMAKSGGVNTIVSQRAGETEDTFIADLAVGLSTGQVKLGAPCRSDRLAKYNQILRIEEELGAYARYAGKNFRNLL